MLKKILKYFLIIVVFVMASCAKRGTITGGKKDTIAPILKTSFPKNGQINFVGKQITLTFDEYVKLKNVEKQLIISPPMKNRPEISPSTASRVITIKIKDTLKPNTTYSFNFGQSIEDNNEANAYKQFKYLFSTGNYIDSLKLGGSIKDALSKDVDHFVSVMLYDVGDKFKDSIVYKENPRYVTNTLDSLKTFRFENLKAGKYLLVAMKDKNGNNKFNPTEDKIGFQKQYITIPNDTVFQLELFKEQLPFKVLKPKQASANRLVLPFEGDGKNVKVILRNGENILPTIITKFPEKDSIQVWYKTIKMDSLKLSIVKNKYTENFKIKIKEEKKDVLSFNPSNTTELDFRDTFSIHSSVPLVKFDLSKMQLLNKDSINVAFTTEYDDYNQNLKINFKKEPLQKYKFKLLPKAMTDYLDKVSDSLSYQFTTKNTTDYGNLKVVLQNVKKFPIIVELTDDKGKVVVSDYSEKNTSIDFNLLIPRLFTLRIIYDDNKNKQWDTGNYLEKKQSEEVIYFPKQIDVRANWDVEQTFDLSK